MAAEQGSAPLVEDLATNTRGQIYGTSKFLLPNPAGMVAEAEFGGKICKICCCPPCPMLCGCVSDEMERRTYARVYENRVEINYAWTYLTLCCLCACSNKQCVSDDVKVYYFDTPPTTAWSAPFPCCCFPCTCFGRPAVGVYTPSLCCCFGEGCGGQTLFASPCKLQCCLCFGNSCFPCAWPFLNPIQNGDEFLSAMKAAYESYADRRGIPPKERARFWEVGDGCCGFTTRKIRDNNWRMDRASGLVEMQVMDRGE